MARPTEIEPRRISRADLFKIGAAGLGAIGLSRLNVRSVEAQAPPRYPIQKDDFVLPPVMPNGWPKRPETSARSAEGLDVNGIQLVGFPDRVDPRTVLVAGGEFQNDIRQGLELIFGDPGDVGFGPDGDKNIVLGSKGHIKYWSDVNLHVARSTAPFFQNLPEGGFAGVIGGGGTIKKIGALEVPGAEIILPNKPNTIYYVYGRALYPDGQQGTDRNLTLMVDGKPAHILFKQYGPPDRGNSAFISLDHFLQDVVIGHSGGSNCGDGGCAEVNVIMFDANTGAFAISRQIQAQSGNPRQGWQLLTKNF